MFTNNPVVVVNAAEVNIRMNSSLSPISSIPRDVLGIIFATIVSRDKERYRPSFGAISRNKQQQLQSLVSLSLVCKKWRQIVFELPSLWTQAIDFQVASLSTEVASFSTARKLLDFTGDTPFDFGEAGRPVIFIEPRRTSSVMEVLSLILENRSRLRSFNIAEERATKERWSRIQSELLQHPAPQMEYLGLRVGTGSGEPHLFLETPLFNDNAPALRIISLKHYAPRFDLFPRILGNLSQLYVQMLNPLSKAPNLDEWLHLLALMPQLQCILIQDSIFPSRAATETPPSVSLDQLKELHLIAPLYECTQILEAVSIPVTCDIVIEVLLGRYGEQINPLVHLVSRGFLLPASVEEREFVLACNRTATYLRDTYEYQLFMAWGHGAGAEGRRRLIDNLGSSRRSVWGDIDPRANAKNGFVCLHLKFANFGENDVLQELARDFEILVKRTAPSYHSVTKLELSFTKLSTDYRISMINPILAPRVHLFTKVKTLKLSVDKFSDNPIFAIPKNSTDDPVDSTPFPSLYEVRLFWGHHRDQLPTDFIEFVRWRKSTGRPIHKVAVKGTKMDMPAFQSEIREAVAVIDTERENYWDLDDASEGFDVAGGQPMEEEDSEDDFDDDLEWEEDEDGFDDESDNSE